MITLKDVFGKRPNMKFMMFIMIVFMLLALLIGLIGCTGPNRPRSSVLSGEEEARDDVTMNQNEAYARHGTPTMTNYQEYGMAVHIQELRDRENLPTYTYTINKDGERRLLCESTGFPLPYSTQTTAPSKVHHDIHGLAVVPQAEPNGLYLPDNVDATWVNCVGDGGESEIFYVEERIMATPRRVETP